MKLHQIWEKGEDGFHYNEQRFKDLAGHLDSGRYLITFQRLNPQANDAAYRRCYFAKIDVLVDTTGNSRYEMHEIVKQTLLEPLVKELPEVYKQPEYRQDVSTLGLSLEGWLILLERLDLWAFVELNTILS